MRRKPRDSTQSSGANPANAHLTLKEINKMFEIKNRFTGAVLFSLETASLKLCVEAAVKSSADLRGADLRDAYLRDADLKGANLKVANLRDAYLRGADLRGADLRGADLRDADLGDANLGGADLRDADLGDAKIRDKIIVQQSPICIQGLEWAVTIWDSHMQIGCEFHSHDEWRGFTKEQWANMGDKEAIKLKRDHMEWLSLVCAAHAAKVSKPT